MLKGTMVIRKLSVRERLVKFVFMLFMWTNANRIKALQAYVLFTTGYGVIVAPIPLVLAQEVGTLSMGGIVTISSALALLGYHLGSALCVRFGSKQVCLGVIPLYMTNVGLFIMSDWLGATWITLGLVNGVVYVAVDAMFRQAVDDDSFGEKLAWNRRIRLKQQEQSVEELRKAFTATRFSAAFTTSALLSYLAAGVGAAIGLWLASHSYNSWVLLALGITAAAYWRLWQVEQAVPSKRVSLKRKGVSFVTTLLTRVQRWKRLLRNIGKTSLRTRFNLCIVRFNLYFIASTYLGVAVANSAFLTFLPLDLGGAMAGIVLMVAKITNGVAYVPIKYLVDKKGEESIFRLAILAMVVGIGLIPLSQSLEMVWLTFPAAVLTGFAVSGAKLSIQLELQHNAPAHKKASATTPLAQVAELGFLIAPVGFAVIAKEHGYTWVWLVAAGFTLCSWLLLVANERRRRTD